MTDAIQIFKPGFRVTDSAGDPVDGAIIEFYAAGTSTPLEVFSDFGLSTSLGVTVTCNSVGLPTSNGSAVVEIYTGADPYKLRITDADGVLIPGCSWDDVKGAVDTSLFLTDADIVASTPVTNTSTNQTPGAADQGKFYNVDCSGGDKSATLAAASVIGDGWAIKVRHDGTANQVLLAGNGTDLFKIGGRAGVTAFALTRLGQTVTITCDGVGFKVEQSSPPLFDTHGVIVIADILSAPPGGPEAGARYLLGAAPSGAWSTFAQHDIAEYSGSGWFKITPPTDIGWLAYVQDEDVYYQFTASAWQLLLRAASDTLAGIIELAVQSEMETATDVLRAVVPGRQQYHPGHPKAWAFVLNGTTAITTDYGCASVSDNGTGDYTLTFDLAFSATGAYTCGGAFGRGTAGAGGCANTAVTAGAKTASTFQHLTKTTSDSAADSVEAGSIYVGDQ